MDQAMDLRRELDKFLTQELNTKTVRACLSVRIVNAAEQVVSWFWGGGSIGATKYEEESYQTRNQIAAGKYIPTINHLRWLLQPKFILCQCLLFAGPAGPQTRRPTYTPPHHHPTSRLSLVNCFIQTTALSTCFNHKRPQQQIFIILIIG